MFKLFPKFLLLFFILSTQSGCYLNSDNASSGSSTFVSFKTDVTAIFTSKCTTSGCHIGATPAGSLNLDPASTDIATIHAYLLANEITLATPDQSQLLMKASNTTTHTGGAVLATSSAEYKTILDWITGGAFNDDCTGVSHGFATNVTPIFTQCTTAGCHDTVKPVLSTTPFDNIDAANDVDATDPINSKLLRKPLGLDSHTGGAIFTDVNDTDYKTIFCWISVDAAANN